MQTRSSLYLNVMFLNASSSPLRRLLSSSSQSKSNNASSSSSSSNTPSSPTTPTRPNLQIMTTTSASQYHSTTTSSVPVPTTNHGLITPPLSPMASSSSSSMVNASASPTRPIIPAVPSPGYNIKRACQPNDRRAPANAISKYFMIERDEQGLIEYRLKPNRETPRLGYIRIYIFLLSYR